MSTISQTLDIRGVGTVHRLGFGAMRLTGRGIWGEPDDPDRARATVRRAVELGVDLIDTADSYGPEVSERLIAEALHPYPAGLRIATKAGQVRTGRNKWIPLGRPEYLRQQIELSLRRLKVETVDLFQLHRIDPTVDADAQFAALAAFRHEGKARALGLSQVTVAEIEQASAHFPVASVQNRYNIADRSSQDVLDYCTQHGIAFIPWAPLDAGRLAGPDGVVDAAARRLGATPSQVTLAWLLQRSPVMVPIPGTASPEHVAENVAAAGVELDTEAIAALDAAA